MRFKPRNNYMLVKKILKLNGYDDDHIGRSMENDKGIFLRKPKMDLYEVVDICPKEESKNNPYAIGDIVTSCATGTTLHDENGNEFILMNIDYITSKIMDFK